MLRKSACKPASASKRMLKKLSRPGRALDSLGNLLKTKAHAFEEHPLDEKPSSASPHSKGLWHEYDASYSHRLFEDSQ